MKLADLALGERDDRNAGEFEVLEQRRHIGLIAAKPVQCLRQNDPDRPRRGPIQQRLKPRARKVRPGDCHVGEHFGHLPPFAQGAFLKRLGVDQRAATLMRGATEAQARDIESARERLTSARAPTDMGALFKCLAVTRAGAPVPPGFEEGDRV